MRRPLLALLVAALTLLTLATPASAGGSTEVVIGHDDGSFVVRTVPAATAASAVASAEEQPGVAWAEVDVPIHIAAAVTPNDPQFDQQWGPVLTRAPEAWSRTTGDPSALIAVIDTGVDATHPDLAGRVLPQQDFVGDGRTGDPSGHGTGVAGVIAGKGNNRQGIAGYCWSCTILPIRALDATGAGSSATVAAGIQYATSHGADVINLSLAGDEPSQAIESAIDQARAAGVLVVAAAGNQTHSGQVLTAPQYPGAEPGVIGVAATTRTDTAYSWTFRGSWADVAAPGCVRTTAPDGAYQDECGTSFASPAVAGILGLAISAFPSAPRSAVEQSLYTSAAALPPGLVSHGRIDAAGVLDTLAATYPMAFLPERIAGTSRVATAIALSQRAFAAAPTVVLARADNYADALGAAPLAARSGGPVLLTGSTALDPAVIAEIRRLGATSVWLAGGDAALSPAVAAALGGMGIADVHRLAGTTRFDTARLIAAQLTSSTAYVVQASDWPSAVAASALAAQTTSPILLVERTSVPAATSEALAALGASNVTVVGDAGLVTDGVLTALGGDGRTVDRLAGANRYETSRLVAARSTAAGGDPHHTWVATGVDWPDALAAGPAAAATGGVLLLVDGRSASTPALTSWVQGVSGGVEELVVVGGVASVPGSSLSSLASFVGR